MPVYNRMPAWRFMRQARKTLEHWRTKDLYQLRKEGMNDALEHKNKEDGAIIYTVIREIDSVLELRELTEPTGD